MTHDVHVYWDFCAEANNLRRGEVSRPRAQDASPAAACQPKKSGEGGGGGGGKGERGGDSWDGPQGGSMCMYACL